MGALRPVLLVLCVALAGCPAPSPDAEPSASDLRWLDWLDREDDAVADLAEPVLDCVQRADTSFGAFHGCYDWHSAVHGVYALHAASRLRDDPQYLQVADSVLSPEAIADELATLENSGPLNEIPYGYSWFLRLHEARERAGRTDLAPLAAVVAEQLSEWIDQLPPDEVADYVLANQYANASWAVVNLHRYASDQGDVALVSRLEDFVRDSVLPAACPLSQETEETDNFFPPCLHRALVLTEVLPPFERDEWLSEWLPESPVLEPLTEFDSAHSAGLNFSRAWGLAALHGATGDDRYRDLWLDHVQTHIDQPEYWREDYLSHSHWIPQFGILAIDLID
jgi:hypothetical protein